MKNSSVLFLLVMVLASAHAADIKVSKQAPITVTAPDPWDTEFVPSPGPQHPFDTYKLTPPGDRNAAFMITVIGKGDPQFKDINFLKKVLHDSSVAFVSSESERSKLSVKTLTIAGAFAVYADCIDPDLVGKPVEKGNYKVATPIFLCLESTYLVHVTVFCDEVDGTDYRELMKVVQSIKLRGSASRRPVSDAPRQTPAGVHKI